MSKDLPLWKDDESDVKVEHWLQFGHVLIALEETHKVDKVLEKIRSVLRLSNPIFANNIISVEKLPLAKKADIVTLEDGNEWHFVLIRVGSTVAVFGPHKQFFSSKNWIKISRKLRTLIALVSQTDLDSYFYYFFLRGRHQCNAYQNACGIHEATAAPIEVYFNGKQIYKYREEEGKLTEEMRRLISQDFVMHVDEHKMIRFKRPLSDEFIEPDEVCHAVFNAKSQKDNNPPSETCNVCSPIDILIEKVGGLFIK